MAIPPKKKRFETREAYRRRIENDYDYTPAEVNMFVADFTSIMTDSSSGYSTDSSDCGSSYSSDSGSSYSDSGSCGGDSGGGW